MGLLKNIFSSTKEPQVVEVFSPLSGNILSITEVPDATFSAKLLGDGIAIEPTADGSVVAPIDGVITQLFETGHAFIVQGDKGVQVLVHFGIDTVSLNGKGFTKILKEGDSVKKGEVVVNYDYNFLKENAKSVITPVVILESEDGIQYNIKFNEEDTIAEAGITKLLEIKL